MPTTSRALLAASLFLITASAIRAQAPAQHDSTTPPPRDPHAVQPERPTVATHAYTVAPGWAEIETGVERDRYPGTHVLTVPTVLKLGVGTREQLDVSVSGIHGTPDGATGTGLGDVSAGLKLHVLDAAPILGDVAVQPSLKLPTGSTRDGFGTGTTDVSLLLISSHQFGPAELDVNVGATRRSGDGANAPTTASLWTAAIGFPLAGAMGWTAELYGYPGTGGPAGSAPIVAVLTGPTFGVREWLAMDAGFIAPIAGPQPHALYAGLVWNMGRAWGAP